MESKYNYTGNKGCPCIDATETLASLEKRSCTTSSEENGVLLTPESASCVPTYYGSNACLQHDLQHNAVCQDLNHPETFCIRPWCFVDLESCKRDSVERVHRSDYLSPSSSLFFDDSGVPSLFYSYTTCNSTGADWESYKMEHGSSVDKVLGGISIASTVMSLLPWSTKKDVNKTIITEVSSPEYKNDTIPFAGVYIDYAQMLIDISNGDIASINYTHRSNSANLMHPDSPGTAAIQDVADGLIDMAIGPYWITEERLKMTAFTVPIVYDKTVLVIKKPGAQSTILAESGKVLEPFEPALVALTCVIVVVAALLSLCFSSKKKLAEAYGKSLRDLQSNKRNVKVYARLALDSILQKSMFFFGASAETDEGAPLAVNILMFGFGFYILIAISAYVANLEAFLTRSQVKYVGTMQGAVDAGYAICAHPALRKELEIKWPDARFRFSSSGFDGVLDDYDAGRCQVMAVGREDTTLNRGLMEKFCERDLVYTDSLIMETPMAFPIKSELVSGMSYWILEGEKYHNISIQRAKMPYHPQLSCTPELPGQEEDLGDYAQISVVNMSLPIIVFAFCAVVSIIVHICGKSWTPLTESKRLSLMPFRKSSMDTSVNWKDNSSDGRRVQFDKSCESSTSTSAACDAGSPDSKPTHSVSRQDKWKGNELVVTEKEQAATLNDMLVVTQEEPLDDTLDISDTDEEQANASNTSSSISANSPDELFITRRSDIDNIAYRIQELVEAELAKGKKETN